MTLSSRQLAAILGAWLMLGTGVALGAAGSDPSGAANDELFAGDDLFPGVQANLDDEPEFLPVDEAFVFSAELTEDGGVLARWTMPDGYYLYKHRFAAEANAGTDLGEPVIPDGKRKVDEYFGEVEVYYHQAEMRVPVHAQSGRFLEVGIEYQGCADYGLCYPPEQKWVSFDVAAGPGSTSAGSASTMATGAGASAGAAAESMNFTTLLAVLGSAILGGLILNLMPCVFPVLSIKALSLIDVESESDRLRHALGYAAGAVFTFIALGALLAALRGAGESIGWGFQLQSPGFVAAMALLFFVLGLNLLGVLELPGFGVAMDKPNPFATGVLAVVVATPCTVPFMGAALGYGMSQSTWVLLAVMTALGIGMALPYVVLTAVPQLSRLLPRPGPWMVRLKQIMAFPLFATVVWLVWVLVMQSGANGVAMVLAACVLLGFLAWLGQGRANRLAAVWSAAVATSALVIWAVPGQPEAATASGNFDVAAIERHRANGEPVFLNLTASWCITCLANDRSTLSSDTVNEFFETRGIRYVKGDWTNADPAITSVLESFGRSGVPLYVYYPVRGEPVVLPQVLTPGIVIDAINDASNFGDIAAK